MTLCERLVQNYFNEPVVLAFLDANRTEIEALPENERARLYELHGEIVEELSYCPPLLKMGLV